MKSFKLSEKIKEAWVLYKNNFIVFFLWFACYFFLNSISSKGSIILSVISAILWICISYMIVRFMLYTLDEKKFEVFSKSFLPTIKESWNFLKTFILFYVINFGLLIIVIVPIFFINPTFLMYGSKFPIYLIISILAAFVWLIFISVRLGFSCFISIDENMGAIKSIKKSWNITKNKFFFVFFKYLLIGLIVFVFTILLSMLSIFSGAASFVIIQIIFGMIITPIGMLVIAMLYRSLSHHHKGVNEIKELKDEVTPIEDRVVKESEVINE